MLLAKDCTWRVSLAFRSGKAPGCSQGRAPWLKDVSSVILQQTLRDQKAAFDNFFNPKLKARYPRFKRKDGRQSIRLTKAAFR